MTPRVGGVKHGVTAQHRV